jgi:hypothetical protein
MWLFFVIMVGCVVVFLLASYPIRKNCQHVSHATLRAFRYTLNVSLGGKCDP